MHYTPAPLMPIRRRSPSRQVLSVDTSALRSQRVEIAMEIAEEVARLCNSGPISTETPLAEAGMSKSQASLVKSWLAGRFELYKSVRELVSDGITAETLASEVLSRVAVISPDRAWCTGEIPIMFEGFDIEEISPEEMELDAAQDVLLSEPPSRTTDTPVTTNISTPVLLSPPSPAVQIKPLNINKDKSSKGRNAFNSDSKLSKRTGFAFDLSMPETAGPLTSFAGHFDTPNSSVDSAFDRIIDWRGSLTGGAFGFETESRLSPWGERRR
ncbi:hypothetical protein BDW22DRAFT_618991 [Trametopsis cervina]|nr:hypothetical protein BDW22DRAFT_618991 [Trametopsis cervina]